MELRILRFGLLQHWNVGVGVFPNGEEILIGGFCLGRISRERVSPAQAEMRKSSNGRVYHNPPMVVDFLKLSGCFVSLMRREIGFPADINGIERARSAQLVRHRSLKDLDGP